VCLPGRTRPLLSQSRHSFVSHLCLVIYITPADPEYSQILPLYWIQNTKRSKIELQLDIDPLASVGGHFDQIKVNQKQTASITLDDCLACSGCVTSAETVLINQQSTAEFLENLSKGGKIYVVTISPHSLTAVANSVGLSLTETAERVAHFLKSLGVHYIFDSAFSSDIALLEAREEFVAKFRLGNGPILTSECPGWICYAEKTQGEKVLPFISSVKSPQQIMGSIVKTPLAARLGKSASEMYHLSVMPCYDKKLEASRPDFHVDADGTREVDCVITTGELVKLMEEKKCDLASYTDRERLDEFSAYGGEELKQLTHVGGVGSSGGYLDHIFRYAAKELFGEDITGPLQMKVGRNADVQEISLEKDGKTVLCFALAYGFRNIQNFVRKVKRNKCKYHYVEIMACPSGCLNGGGQIKHDIKELKAQRAFVDDLAELHNSRHTHELNDLEGVPKLYAEWVGGKPYSEEAQKLFHTQYHAVDSKEVNPLTIQW